MAGCFQFQYKLAKFFKKKLSKLNRRFLSSIFELSSLICLLYVLEQFSKSDCKNFEKKELLSFELNNVLLSKSVQTSIWHDVQSSSDFFKLFTCNKQIISRGSPHVAKFFVAKIFSSVSLSSFLLQMLHECKMKLFVRF